MQLREIAEQLPQLWRPETNWTESMAAARLGYLEGMSVWVRTFDILSGDETSHPVAQGLADLSTVTVQA